MDPTLFVFAMLIVVVGMMFFGGRKQRRQLATMQEMQRALEPGDIVSTTSGLRATVVDASYEDTIDLEIADGVVTTWTRAAIREKIETDEPAVVDEAPAVVEEEPAPAPALPAIDLEKAEKGDSPNGSHRS